MIGFNMKKVLTLGLVGSLATSLAYADDHDEEKETRERGFYVSGSIGQTADADATFSAGGASNRRVGESTLAGDKLVGDIAVGYSFGNNLRLEAELGFTPFDIEGANYVRFDGVPLDLVNQHSQVTGTVQTKSLSLNLFYDFNLGKWKPYLGVGAGLMNVDLSSSIQVFDVSISNDDRDQTTVISAMLGVRRALTEEGRVLLDVGLTHSRIGETSFVTDGRTLDADDMDLTTFKTGLTVKLGGKKSRRARNK
ncbi:MAG: outer membrane beta-barrel protein [Bacteriovoracales bacterium]|nr:outer membrane beta-barrel protein [Bacteriovoracales bacterium]